MARDTILCMFSGGIDSTGVLHQMFDDEQYQTRPLIVQHIFLQNRENRAQAEIESVRKIMAYYQETYADRKFTYTESVFNTTGFAPLKASRFPFDMDVCAFVAANVCVSRKDIGAVAMGRTKTDLESGGDNFKKRMERAQNIFRAVYSLEPEPLPDYIFPVVDMTKQEIWQSMPEQVQTATWYCRQPVYAEDGSATACGKCITCKEVAAFL
ncbi:MAG: 7-cyano-7-deazaguanine synthase [Pseudomonadota bacterium]